MAQVQVGDYAYATLDAKGAPIPPLGKGAYGTVYKGYHIKTGEPVAIKLITNLDAHMNKFLDNELSIHKKLVHPSLVRCYHVEVRRPTFIANFKLS